MGKSDMKASEFLMNLPNPETVDVDSSWGAPTCTLWNGHLAISVVNCEEAGRPRLVMAMDKWQEEWASVKVDHDEYRNDDATGAVYSQLRVERSLGGRFEGGEKYYVGKEFKLRDLHDNKVFDVLREKRKSTPLGCT